MRKIAICGLWHVHAEHLTRMAMKYAEVIGVWDDDPIRLDEFCSKTGIPAFLSFEEMLNSEADGFIVCNATSRHAEVMEKIAAAKKHIFTEKMLATTEADCARIEKAVKENGVDFAICFPNVYYSFVRAIKDVMESGELGKVNYIRFRYCTGASADDVMPAHFYNEEETGGGTMFDHGAHGMHAVYYLKGVPSAYKSVFSNACSNESANAKIVGNVEDNAVVTMLYDDGCIAINESSGVNGYTPMVLEVSGESGTVFYTCDKVMKMTGQTDGEFTEVKNPPSLPHPLVQFINRDILDGCRIDDAVAVTKMMIDAYKNR